MRFCLVVMYLLQMLFQLVYSRFKVDDLLHFLAQNRTTSLGKIPKLMIGVLIVKKKPRVCTYIYSVFRDTTMS